MIEKIYDSLLKNFNFEKREEQLKLSKFINDTILEKNNALIESPTGSGKTIAYLIPAVISSMENKKIIISTNTLNLQEQIINKEIPLLEKLLEIKLNYSIVKGRGNYICKRRLYELNMNNSNKLIDDEKYSYLFNDKIGDKSNFSLKNINKFWNEINSDKDLTLYKKCPFFSDCFFYNSRAKIDNSNIFIVNHHILLLDNILKNNNEKGILPNYDIAIIDEAHNMEKLVRKYYSKNFSFKDNLTILGKLYNRNAKNINESGLIYRFMNSFKLKIDNILIEESILEISSIINDIYNILNELRTYIIFNSNEKLNYLIEIETFYKKSNNLIEIENKLNNLNEKINLLTQNNTELEEIAEFILIKNLIKTFTSNIFTLINIFEFDIDKNIYHISYEEDKSFPNLIATPYDISDFNEKFLKKIDSSIFLSATLTTNNGFKDLERMLGIEKYNQLILKSTFELDKKMKINIVKDMLDVNDDNFKNQLSKLCNEYSLKNSGKTLILFTSYNELEFVYKYMIKQNNKLNILKQGDFSKNELIKLFMEKENSILLGTESFWEGVDIKGDALTYIIIPKIPFLVPDDPITYSISKRMEEKNINSFNNYQLPYAILKLKQGVGRLIRDKNDSGEILLLDKRLLEKSYGKIILKSLPSKNISIKKYIDIVN